MKEYVLVSQGIEIYRTKCKEEAVNITKINNENLEKLEKLVDDKRDFIDNKIFIEEDDIDEHELHIRDIIINDFATQIGYECDEDDEISETEKEKFLRITDVVKKRLENKYIDEYGN